MKRIFYIGIFLFVVFEILRVYFIMPMPGSQEGEAVEYAFFLHQWRWAFRILFLLVIAAGAKPAFQGRRFVALAFAVFAAGIAYLMNFVMAADGMFLQPNTLVMATAAENKVDPAKLVMGIEYNGEAKAYPIQLIAYHHQVLDTVGGMPLMITYCSVCRTGRIFQPMVQGKPAVFRLVGMDHYNAMFEDDQTGSWWRQGTGEAVAGSLKGQMLPELSADHSSLGTWLALHPNSTVMQPDPDFLDEYAELEDYDIGKGGGDLVKTDPGEWQEKSWVVGIVSGKHSKAFSWKRMKDARIVEELVGPQAVLLALAPDDQSFFAYERPDSLQGFHFLGDTLAAGMQHFNFAGKNLSTGPSLKPLRAYQEFWHSWRTFHPDTEKW